MRNLHGMALVLGYDRSNQNLNAGRGCGRRSGGGEYERRRRGNDGGPELREVEHCDAALGGLVLLPPATGGSLLGFAWGRLTRWWTRRLCPFLARHLWLGWL